MGRGRTLSPVFCGGCVPFLEAAGGFDEPWGVSLEILSTSVEVKLTRPAQNRDLFSRDANQQDENDDFQGCGGESYCSFGFYTGS